MKFIFLLFLILVCVPVYAQKASHKKSAKIEKCEEQANYKETIAIADKAFSTEDFLTAHNMYEKAMEICPEAEYSKNKVAETKQIIYKKGYHNEENERINIIAAADTAFAQKNYAKARDYYQRALIMKPSDPYPKQKLKEIDEILAKTSLEKETEPLEKEQ